MYSALKKLLFLLPAEHSHNLALAALKRTPNALIKATCQRNIKDSPRNVMGIDFPNAVGLAAGLDKNADYYTSLAQFGFGFLEVGTVTPLAQAGNDKPRMFRLKQDQAVINRMGFNNFGVDYLAGQVRRAKFNGVLGINIGKNKDTPNEHASDDYEHCLQIVYPLADYITVNISSPNTPGLRDLQSGESNRKLLATIKRAQDNLAQRHGRYVPIAVKVAPDMAVEDLNQFSDAAVACGIDAIIAGNTTLARGNLQSSHATETGGLSGKPLTAKARQTIEHLAQRLQHEIPIIGCGGIFSADDALGHLSAGASLVQVYTGLIYRGPSLINEIRHALTTTSKSAN